MLIGVADENGDIRSPVYSGSRKRVLMLAQRILEICGTKYHNSGGGGQVVRGGECSFMDPTTPNLHSNTSNSIRDKFDLCFLCLFSGVSMRGEAEQVYE